MNTELYCLIGALADSLEWCHEQLEELDPEDDRVIKDVLSQANKVIQEGL
jgi:hypothetical protein